MDQFDTLAQLACNVLISKTNNKGVLMKLSYALTAIVLTVSANSFAGTPQSENYSMLAMVQAQIDDAFKLTDENKDCLSKAMRESLEKNGVTEEKLETQLIDAGLFHTAGDAAVKSCNLK